MRAVHVILALMMGVILGVPFLLRPAAERRDKASRSVVIVTPHTEQIRSEFGRGFEAWHKRVYGESVRVDWRSPGGTSEIYKQLQAQYEAAVAQGKFDFSDPKNPTAPAGTIPYSLMIGGGTYEFGRLKAGIAVRDPKDGSARTIPISTPAGFSKEQIEEWFGDNRCGAQALSDPDQFWIGTALSSFGIVYNKEIYKELGLTPPTSFEDLGNPKLQGFVALADPRQSGSIATTMDSILNFYVWDTAQKEGWDAELSAAMKAEGDAKRKARGEGKSAAEVAAIATWEESLWDSRGESIERAWDQGWRVLREMACNTRYFTSSAPKPPLDVSHGEAAAGLSIDFYGRSQAQAILLPGQSPDESRVGFVDPAGAVYIDADPASILRGGLEPELARRFIEYSLTEEGQALWQFPAKTNAKSAGNPVDASGMKLGPAQYELRRLPVRRSMYEPGMARHMIDQVDPFAIASKVSAVGWRDAILPMMGAFAIDVSDEARGAWGALCRARAEEGFSKETLAEMERLFYSWPTSVLPDAGDASRENAAGETVQFGPLTARRVREHWRNRTFQAASVIGYTSYFRETYRKVIELESRGRGQVRAAAGR
jgi:iron(III) transport system substrate-binding protein